MAKATPIFEDKRVFNDGAIIEVRILSVPSPVRGSSHGLKYSLFYGVRGRRILAYDNEAGKGDHVHRDDVESSYKFTSVEQLLEDFFNEVEVIRRGDV